MFSELSTPNRVSNAPNRPAASAARNHSGGHEARARYATTAAYQTGNCKRNPRGKIVDGPATLAWSGGAVLSGEGAVGAAAAVVGLVVGAVAEGPAVEGEAA